MAIAPWSNSVNAWSPSWYIYAYYTGWSHFENGHWKSGTKTNVSKLPGGTPWRYPTSYNLDIYNIKKSGKILTLYPNGHTWEGCPFSSTSGVFYALNAEGWAPGNSGHPNYDVNLWNECTTKALQNLNNRKVDLGSNIAEGRQALRMVSTRSIQIFKAMIALKRGQFGRVLRELGMNRRDVLTGRFPANLWLEYQFGWRPLLNDIYDGYQRFSEAVTKDLIVTGKASAKRTHEGQNIWNADMADQYTVAEKCFCRLDAIVNCPELVQANQWGLLNPLEILWEVTPWSFAVDWFVPVGNVLEASTAKAGLTWLSGSVSQTREHHERTYFDPAVHVGGYTILENGEFVIEKLQHKRSPLYDFPTPGLYTRENPFTSTHATTALALWRQLLPLR